ncbi:MAG: hypothetical protein KJN62_04935 [Deltaproteobacteria bacterium]|nr:hypothetical protein [Deltaproteobacteria bacterium]
MTEHLQPDQLARNVRQIYRADPLQAENLIEAFLEQSFRGLSEDERITIVDELCNKFEADGTGPLENVTVDQEVLSRIFSFLLGREVSQAELSSDELLQRLAGSLNTIFDMLNQLISVINMTFLGQGEGVETIRQVIGFHLEGGPASRSLESYLGQINKAFLIAHQAFKLAGEKKVSQILTELDPKQIAAGAGGGFKFGPLRKADCFDRYAERYKVFEQYFDSGRFTEELLREFENNCQKLFLQ